MAFWRRINQSKLQFISNQCKRFYLGAPYASSLDQTRVCFYNNFVSSVDKKPSYFYNNVRFFAAPVQAKKNIKEEVSKGGPRLNEQITANPIRLVIGEDHSIVSLHEAMRRAKELDLDLVEVDCYAKPIVCKIMDFNQVRYQRQAIKKERAKKRAGEILKKDSPKEIRFSEKIEGNDLKQKAEAGIRLMERGYRVKFTATGKGKEDEEEDLGGQLSHLIELIKDVSFMETEPKVERKHAYVIVRHVKFGPAKKAGGKSSKVVGDTKAEHPTGSGTDRQNPMVPRDNVIESVSESENEILPDEDDLPTSSPMHMQDKSVEGKKTAWTISESGDEPRNQLPPTRSMDRMGQRTREPFKSGPRFSYQQQQPPQSMNAYQQRQPPQNMNTYQRQQPPQNMNAYQRQQPIQNMNAYQQRQPPQSMNGPSSVGETKQVGDDASLSRNSRPNSNDLPKQQPSNSDVPGKPARSFGIFSIPNANLSGKQGINAADANGSNEGNRYASVPNRDMGRNGASQNSPGSQFDGSQRLNPNGDVGAKDKFGIFSRGSSNTTPNRTPNSN
ncbi:Translation initiation factor 3 [Corchorus olitorius]|uniref:Translation initiation factor 3 n=1 Tax=Corchorus olitorius TaxID=93759 RepID=A0A1R3JD31_9ROSI|nr:Translation initiation factor 3 [Corchorus olitorius]